MYLQLWYSPFVYSGGYFMKSHAMRKMLLGSVALGSLVSLSGISWAGPLIRLAAEFDYFGETAGKSTLVPPDGTAAGAGGIPIYRKTVTVPKGANTLYVTLSAAGQTQEDATACFAANLLDVGAGTSVPFNAGQTGANCFGPQPGWVALLKQPCAGVAYADGNCQDNSISYQWCTAVTPGVIRDVEIRMATGVENKEVFIETAHFYVDAASVPGGCVQATPPAG
jgi:hypothetical protein